MSKQTEMEATYNGWEWVIREKLEQLDSIARKMYNEMGIFGVSFAASKPFVNQKIAEMIVDISRKGDEEYVKIHNQLRRGKTKHPGSDEDI